jgi:hypothetical protein
MEVIFVSKEEFKASNEDQVKCILDLARYMGLNEATTYWYESGMADLYREINPWS